MYIHVIHTYTPLPFGGGTQGGTDALRGEEHRTGLLGDEKIGVA